MHKFLMGASALLLLAACGVSSSSGVISHGKNSGGFMGLAENAPVEVSGEEALKGVQKVIIGGFRVGFAESSAKSNKAGGGLLGGGFGGKASGKMRLEGVSESLKQQIANSAYSNFVSQLKKQGYTVVNRSQFTSSEEYKDVTKYDFPYEMDDSGFFSSYGVTKFYQPSALGKKGIMLMGEIQGFSGGMGFGFADQAAVEFAKETGIAVVSGTYLVDFAATDGHGGSWSSSASIQVGQNLSVTSGVVKFVKDWSSTFQSGTASINLGQPIQSGKEFATVVDDTSDVNTAVQEVTNVISVLGGMGTNRSKEYVIKANPGKYKKYSGEILSKANEALLLKASSLR
jgi:hypothetical protein